MQIQYFYEHTFAQQRTLCAEKHPVFEIVQESVKVGTTGMFSKIIYAQHPVTKNFHISPRFSPTIFYRDANSVLLPAHFCTAVSVGSMRRTLCSKLFMMRACFVCVFSSYLFWTSSSLDVPAGVTQDEGRTGFLIHLPSAVHALIFLTRRIWPFLSLVDREVKLCVLMI